MTAISFFVDEDSVAERYGAQGAGWITKKIDFSRKNVAQNDTVQVFSFPAGTMIHNVSITVETAEGGTLTVDVGITGDDPNGFDAGVNLNSTSTFSIGVGATDAYITAGGKLLTTADTLDLLMNNAADTAVIRVAALISNIPQSVN